MQGSTYQHQQLQKQFLVEGQIQFPDLVFLPMTVGMFRDFQTAERIVRVGEKGTLDVLVLGKKKYMFFDTKTGKAVLSKEQKAFKQTLDRINGGEVCFVTRNIHESFLLIRRYFYGE